MAVQGLFPGCPDHRIVEETMYSRFFPVRSRATYNSYVQLPKLLMKNEQLIPRLEGLSEETGIGKKLGLSSLDIHAVYRSVDEDVMLMVEAADFFIKNLTKNSPVSRCVFLQGGNAPADGPERAIQCTLCGRVCILPVVHGCEVAGDAGSIEI